MSFPTLYPVLEFFKRQQISWSRGIALQSSVQFLLVTGRHRYTRLVRSDAVPQIFNKEDFFWHTQPGNFRNIVYTHNVSPCLTFQPENVYPL